MAQLKKIITTIFSCSKIFAMCGRCAVFGGTDIKDHEERRGQVWWPIYFACDMHGILFPSALWYLIFDHSPWSLEQCPHRFHSSLVKLGPTCQCVNQFCKGRLWKGSPEVVSRKSWHQSLAQPVHWCQMLFTQPYPMRYKMQNENIEI